MDINDIEQHFEGTIIRDVVEDDDEDDIIIGIDLGTTNSCVGIWRNGNFEVIPDEYGNHTLPSIVSFTKVRKYIGHEAKNQTEINPDFTFYEIKRLIGRKIDDDSVVNDMEFFTFNIKSDKEKSILLETPNNIYAPEQMSAILLTYMKEMACKYLNRYVNKAVITVPAYFNDAQRQATKDAADIAGLECVRIINEPTAASLAYGLQQRSQSKDMNVIVYDFGGGTLDVSLLNIADSTFQVLASTGNTHLGGADFDNRLMSFSMSHFKKKYKYDILENISNISLQKLRNACERAKRHLSTAEKTVVSVPDFYDGKILSYVLTRTKFEEVCSDIFKLCLKPLEDVLVSGGYEKEEIDEIILVGGATRIPLIRNNIRMFLNKIPNCSLNPDEVVATGAAIQGWILSHKGDVFADSIALLDIVPLSLGIETIGGVMDVLIKRNSIIPTSKTKKYTTDKDNESSVTIKIYEGERSLTKDNFFIGEFDLDGIRPAPVGAVKINVTFSIDVNGIVNITAKDLDNDENVKTITITGHKSGLTKSQISNMVLEARKMEEIDKINRMKKMYHYEISDLCSIIETNLKDSDFKINSTDKESIFEDLSEVKKYLNEKDYTERDITDYKERLSKLKKKFGVLVHRSMKTMDGVKGANKDTDGTNVYEEDDDDVIDMGKINDEEEFDEDKEKCREKKAELVSLCNRIKDILGDTTIKFDADLSMELNDFIDDTILWYHVKPKITMDEYSEKINQINNSCNKLLELSSISNIEVDNKYDLERLCYAVRSSLSSNSFSFKEDDIQFIYSEIGEILEWLLDINVNNKDVDDSVYLEKINYINSMCEAVYNKSTRMYAPSEM